MQLQSLPTSKNICACRAVPETLNSFSHATGTAEEKKVDCKAQRERQMRVNTLVFDRHEGGATKNGLVWLHFFLTPTPTLQLLLRLTEFL